jgi:putative flavoprotein involved in K+ transport
VLIVGGGNSGADIAMDLAPHHRIWLAGREVGQVPFDIEGFWSRLFLMKLVMRVVLHRLLTIKTPLGRKARPGMTAHGGPLVRLKAKQLRRAGVVRVPRVAGVRDGLPLLDDGRVLDVANVIWAAGFDPGFSSWIDLPIFEGGAHGEPSHRAGIVDRAPGLYFVGLHFLYSASSAMIHGVGRDAARIAAAVAARRAEAPSAAYPDGYVRTAL